MQKNPDKSVFEINNRYPVTKKLHDGADILIFDDFLKNPDAYKEILRLIILNQLHHQDGDN